MKRRNFLAYPALATPLLFSGRASGAAPALPMQQQTIECFGRRWLVHESKEWKVEGAGEAQVLKLDVARPQEASPRAPVQYALLDEEPAGCLTLEVEMKGVAAESSMIVVYAWRDPVHFDYVHLSTDAARKQPVHNGVFHVYGGDRVRISNEEGPASFTDGQKWTRVKVVYDGAKGLVETWVEGEKIPSLRGADFSLGAGRVGLGSFFNTGSFRGFTLRRGAG